MEIARSARAGTLASKKPPKTYKRQFIQYEPELVEELNSKKTRNQSVSGRLLTLLYQRLVFWSRYAKHQYKGRRYFWKTISELSLELQYSTKQVSRGLKSLEELGMIKREKLNKHNWKHQYYYYLPKSVHTSEPAAATETRTNGSHRRTTSSSSGASGRSSAAFPSPIPPEARAGASEAGAASGKGTGGSPMGTVGSGVAAQEEPVKPFRRRQRSQNVPFIINKKTPLLENQLRSIVEKCLDYGINPPNPITGRGVGFRT